MIYAKSSKRILKMIGCDKLSLEYASGDYYWYFIYDDPANEIFETQSVYVMRLNSMSLERWVEDGKSFVKKIESEN